MAMPTKPSCKVIARLVDGRIFKGTTHDFAPHNPKLHLCPGGDPGAETVALEVRDLKAIFFVKTFEGNPQHRSHSSFEEAHGQGRKILVTFKDGEQLAGFATSYSPDKPGFFVVPADTASNNERVFVVRAAVRKVEWITAAVPV